MRYSSLKANAKLLYGEITTLSNKLGYMYASNNYFAELYNVNKNTISLWIKDLRDHGFIEVDILKDYNGQIIERRISIIKNNGIIKNDDTPILKNDDYNIINKNTIKDNIYKREINFKNLVLNYSYDKKMLSDFLDYWTEPNKNGSKMRFEMEKTWDLNKRLKRWNKNSKKWDTSSINKKSKIEKIIEQNQIAKDIMKDMFKNKNIG